LAEVTTPCQRRKRCKAGRRMFGGTLLLHVAILAQGSSKGRLTFCGR
jgi:hypothetical protein